MSALKIKGQERGCGIDVSGDDRDRDMLIDLYIGLEKRLCGSSYILFCKSHKGRLNPIITSVQTRRVHDIFVERVSIPKY